MLSFFSNKILLTLNKLLSDGNSSRLNVELVEKSQKCVYAGAFTFNLEDPGMTIAFSMANSEENPKDIENLRKNNLALGGSVNNAIVIDDYKIVNEDGLRYKDEFVKHKILDAIGDLYLLGHSLIGSFSAFKSGHHLNNLLLRELVHNESAWEEVIIEDEKKTPILFTHVTESI